MKKLILMLLLLIGMVTGACAQYYGRSNNASVCIVNKSDYDITVKIMKTYGRGLYQTVHISSHCSSTVYFSNSDSYYTKTKAVKNGILGTTLYKKGGGFSVTCDSRGYSQGTMEFYVSSNGYGSSGQSISKADFESNK